MKMIKKHHWVIRSLLTVLLMLRSVCWVYSFSILLVSNTPYWAVISTLSQWTRMFQVCQFSIQVGTCTYMCMRMYALNNNLLCMVENCHRENYLWTRAWTGAVIIRICTVSTPCKSVVRLLEVRNTELISVQRTRTRYWHAHCIGSSALFVSWTCLITDLRSVLMVQVRTISVSGGARSSPCSQTLFPVCVHYHVNMQINTCTCIYISVDCKYA